MRRIQDVLSYLIAPAPAYWPPQWAMASPFAKASEDRQGWVALLRSLFVPCIFLVSLLLLAACDDGVHVKGYDYEKKEKAKVLLPKGSSMDIDTRSFIVKKKYDFPYWGR